MRGDVGGFIEVALERERERLVSIVVSRLGAGQLSRKFGCGFRLIPYAQLPFKLFGGLLHGRNGLDGDRRRLRQLDCLLVRIACLGESLVSLETHDLTHSRLEYTH